MELTHRLTLLFLIVLICKKTFPTHTPKITLIKNGFALQSPTTDREKCYKKQLNNLLTQDKNLPGLFGVHNKFNAFRKNFPFFLKAIYSPNLQILTIQQKNSILGALFFYHYPLEKELYISFIAIDENNQSKGLGSLLIKGLERSYPEHKAKLKVYKENTKAISFYEKCNFVCSQLQNESGFLNLEKRLPKTERLYNQTKTQQKNDSRLKITTIQGSINLLYPGLLTDRILRKQLNKLMLEKKNVPGLFGQTKKELKEEQPSLPKFLNQFYGPQKNIILLQKNDRLIGALYFSLLNEKEQKTTVYVDLLTITTTQQKKGYGRMLLNHLRKLHPEKKVRLNVYRDNKSARKFYKIMGFKEQDRDFFCATLEQEPSIATT